MSNGSVFRGARVAQSLAPLETRDSASQAKTRQDNVQIGFDRVKQHLDVAIGATQDDLVDLQVPQYPQDTTAAYSNLWG